MEIRELLRSSLEDPELQEALSEAFSTGIDSPADFTSIELADHIRHARGIDVAETPFEELPGKLEATLQSFVIDRLPRPTPITLSDLEFYAFCQLSGIRVPEMNNEDWEGAYKRFVSFALSELEVKRETDLHHFFLGDEWELEEEDCWPEHDNLHVGLSDACWFPIWSSDTGFHLTGLGSMFDRLWVRVWARLAANCSDAAMREALDTLQRHLDSVTKSIKLTHGFQGELLCTPMLSLIDGPGRLMMSTCLTAIWGTPAYPNDELLNRLRNAIVLLSEADKIELEPVALSLSFAAIEALVCEDDKPVTPQVKRHVATLLVQDTAKRGKKETVTGKLYTIRCRVLHGSKIDWPEAEEVNAIGRMIAAGVILAVSYWRDNQLRAGGDTSWKELMDELNAASRKPAMVVGVPDLSDLIPDKLPIKVR